ncbi:toxin secretion/phage lysis holin [Bacillus thuringiensis]
MIFANGFIKTSIATLGSFYGYFFGEWDTAFQILLTLVMIDYITGMIAAGYNGELKSKVGFKGIAKKLMLFLLVGVAVQLDTIMGINSTIREATIFFFIGNELLSILENCGRLGIPLPDVLYNAVHILNSKNKKSKNAEK